MTDLCIDAVGVDYMVLSDFRIRWLADQVQPRFITNPGPNDDVFEVTIIDDTDPEPREYFEIDLTLNPTGNNRNGVFFPRAVGRVTIIDDDTRKFLHVRQANLILLFLISQFQEFGAGGQSSNFHYSTRYWR